MIRSVSVATAGAAVLMLTSGSLAAFDNTIYSAANDPSTYGSLIASLDVDTTAYTWPANNGAGKLDSGFKAEILDGAGNPLVLDFGVNPNVTQLTTDVYRVTSPQSIGGLSVQTGDLAFAYRIQLVGNNANTIETLQKFGIDGRDPGLDPNGGGTFTDNEVYGRAFTFSGLSNPGTAFPVTTGANDYKNFGVVSFIDYQWELGNQLNQLNNAEEITLLLFARGATVTNGFANFAGTSGQASPTTDTVANDVPILIPTVPGPGSLALLGIGGMLASRRRRD